MKSVHNTAVFYCTQIYYGDAPNIKILHYNSCEQLLSTSFFGQLTEIGGFL